MSAVIGNPLLATGADGYQISRSVRFRSSASAYFSRTFATTGTSRTKATYSGWIKRGALGVAGRLVDAYDGTSVASTTLYFTTGDQLNFDFGGAAATSLTTLQVFRDASAWYHIVLAYDTTQATAANRVKMYVNGVQINAFSSATWPAQNALSQWFFNNANNRIGSNWNGGAGLFFDGYMTEVNFIDGQALTPDSFGEYDSITGVWKPKKYTGTYGTNGFYLPFSDNGASIGNDYSGNNNHWTATGVSTGTGILVDSMIDVPMIWDDGDRGRGNYCTLNPLWEGRTGTLSEGNSSIQSGAAIGTMDVSQFNSYWEVRSSALNNATASVYGISAATTVTIPNGPTVYGFRFTALSGLLEYTTNGSTWTTLTTVSLVRPYFPYITGGTGGARLITGANNFTYSIPSGFKALHTGNLPEPSIKKPNQWMDATVYSGSNTAGRSIINTGQFQPDLVWIKNRTTANNNILTDAVRGATKTLISNLTDAEATVAGALTAFNTNGFQIGYDGTTIVNASGNSYVAWQWKEGATPGFDIVTYTGTGVNRTVAHSLGVAPGMVIVKKRTGTIGVGSSNWMAWHKNISASQVMYLDTTDAVSTNATAFNSTTPTSSVFSLGTNTLTNENTGTYVAYLFAEVPGFSRFGSYTGNGSTDGPFINCGFRPRWVLVKRTDIADNWHVYDSVRSQQNVAAALLRPNTADVEATFNAEDFLSNGFKIRDSGTGFNASGGTYIYAAFAESPFKYALAR